jgi:hypothetical protein
MTTAETIARNLKGVLWLNDEDVEPVARAVATGYPARHHWRLIALVDHWGRTPVAKAGLPRPLKDPQKIASWILDRLDDLRSAWPEYWAWDRSDARWSGWDPLRPTLSEAERRRSTFRLSWWIRITGDTYDCRNAIKKMTGSLWSGEPSQGWTVFDTHENRRKLRALEDEHDITWQRYPRLPKDDQHQADHEAAREEYRQVVAGTMAPEPTRYDMIADGVGAFGGGEASNG